MTPNEIVREIIRIGKTLDIDVFPGRIDKEGEKFQIPSVLITHVGPTRLETSSFEAKEGNQFQTTATALEYFEAGDLDERLWKAVKAQWPQLLTVEHYDDIESLKGSTVEGTAFSAVYQKVRTFRW